MKALLSVFLVVACAAPVSAQIDPLLFLKGSSSSTRPNVILMVDTSERMQRDAAGNYYDPLIYTRTGAEFEVTLRVPLDAKRYRRRFDSLKYAGSQATADRIVTVADSDAAAFARFEAPTRLALARAAMSQAVTDNTTVANFALYKTRQKGPVIVAGATLVSSVSQGSPTENGGGLWNMARGKVDVANGVITGVSDATAAVVAPGRSNADILDILARDPRGVASDGVPAGPFLVPAGLDGDNIVDSPVHTMIVDLQRVAFDQQVAGQCRNTVAVLITGGGEGTTSGGADPAVAAVPFLLNALGRRVPIVVVALAPPRDEVAQLTAIAAQSGGQYFEITPQQIESALASPQQANASRLAGTLVVPELVKAINVGIQTAFQRFDDLNTKQFWRSPWIGWKGYAGSSKIPSSEFQAAGPVVGTVNLNDARDISGRALTGPQPREVKDKAGAEIPQRNNLMVTSGFVLPGFDGVVRGFRVYRAVADAAQASGYRFESDGTPLWVASAPPDSGSVTGGASYRGDSRNLYTVLADGALVAFKAANATLLAPLMNLSVSDAAAVISAVRAMPLGAVINSTPAIMNPPSRDPPPDSTYPAFAKLHEKRRTILWVGTNRGLLEALDARTGVEVWGFVPPNLLPRLKSLRDGQTIGAFKHFMDASPRVSDVFVPGRCDESHPELCWRTHLVVGQGAGGTFYQSFDVTLDGLDAAIAPDSSETSALLSFFSNPSRVTVNWSFPRYSHFDPTSTARTPFGDLHASATELEKTVGQTWSTPAIGQIASDTGPYSVLVGSGFLPFSIQQQRKVSSAGTTFYILNVSDGSVYASIDVGTDGLNENSDGCGVVANDCRQIKNALQADPLAAGASDPRFITRAYLGDLDGVVWRFDITLDGFSRPSIGGKRRLFPGTAGNGDQPIFGSMATVNVAGLNQYIFFGTGSDLLPSTGSSTVYHLLGINDNGTVPAPRTFDIALAKTASLSADEKVTALPAVAGDIVFFTTTTFSSAACTAPSGNLYALTFLGGPAYDTNADKVFDRSDSVKAMVIAGERATAPFIVDQHLVFGAGGTVSLFGDPAGYNNGVGNAGVRILSWREVR